MIISCYQAKELLEAKSKGLKEAIVSLNLNLSPKKVIIENDLFIFPNNQKLQEQQFRKCVKDNTSCFSIQNNSLVKIQFFSEQTNKFYKLVPTKDAPTLEISGIRMHVTKEMTPMEDTRRKIESISLIKRIVLDTCMGLGYTAILASKYADFVFTCEKDANVLKIAQLNPWSKDLFNNKKISVINADILKQIKVFKNNMFDAVIHDPPRLSLATELYSSEFCKQLYRVLKKNGRLYHYIGSPGSKNRKINLAKNVGEKLRTAGFKDIEKVHYGLKARK